MSAISGISVISKILLLHILVILRPFLLRHVQLSEQFVDMERFKCINHRVLLQFSLLLLADMVNAEDFIVKLVL